MKKWLFGIFVLGMFLLTWCWNNAIIEEEITKVRGEVSNFTYSELESKLAISFANKQMAGSENHVETIPLPEPVVNQFALLIEKYRKN